MLDLIKPPTDAMVVGVDVEISDRAKSLDHPRIRMIKGNSVSDRVVAELRQLLPEGGGLVSLDSDHSKEHVLRELRAYAEFVAPNSYMVVEDTNLNGHPVNWAFGPGPLEAVREFLKKDDRFVSDDTLWRRNLISHHAGGWLRRTQI